MLITIELHNYYRKYIYRGAWVLQVDADYGLWMSSFGSADQRISIDTGCFVPGIYRVTPYTISSSKPEQLQIVTCEREYVTGTYKFVGVNTGHIHGKEHVDLEKTPYPSTASYESIALQKAYGKVANADLALGESIGEYRETIRMLRRPLSDLQKFFWDNRKRNWRLLTALRNKDKRSVNRLLGRTGLASADTMTNTWLELRYGLRPLVFLVQDVIAKVNAKRDALFDPTTIRSVRSAVSFENNTKDSLEYALGSILHRMNSVVNDKVKCTASVQYRQSAPSSLLDQLGLTPRHLPEIAWELTRLSFVVDWIFTIGPWLATLRVAPNVSILGNTVGVKVERSCKVTDTESRYYTLLAQWSPGVPDSEITYRSYTRKTQVDIPVLPQFTWGNTLDLYKVVDLISLLWQRKPLT